VRTTSKARATRPGPIGQGAGSGAGASGDVDGDGATAGAGAGATASGSAQGSPGAGFFTPCFLRSACTFSLGCAPTDSQYRIRLTFRTVRASLLRTIGS
jgi:hypothetical protein